MNLAPTTLKGYQLLHQGTQALADAEENGIIIDIEYVKKKQKHISRQIKYIKKKLEQTKEIKKWRKVYGHEFNLDSNTQFADILFNYFQHEPKIYTPKGNPSVSKEALQQLDIPIVDDIVRLRQLQKVKETYLENYIRETVDSVLHCFYHLHTTVTYRSSCSRINFQNQPVRIPEIKKIVRNAVIARLNHLLIEIDYSAIEVSIAACMHKDPNMIKDIIDPNRDMHRDMAMECFMLEEDEWTKNTRYCGKNMFVFPQFYGDYFKTCAESMWMAIKTLNLETKQGVPLHRHLKKHGLGTYQKFEDHIKNTENYFWNERYPIYKKWKEDHYQKYVENGYVDLKTGFRCKGLMSKNDAINYPIQGPAFHCLLWSFIQTNRWVKENLTHTKVVGQIHDAMVSDVHADELNDFMSAAIDIMVNKLVLEWDWIIVPLKVEAEAGILNGSWYTKKEIKNRECECGINWMWELDEYWECPICAARQDL